MYHGMSKRSSFTVVRATLSSRNHVALIFDGARAQQNLHSKNMTN